MEENKKENPLQSLLDFYNKQVEEGNKKGFGDLYKEATEAIFKEIQEDYKHQLDYWSNKDKGLPKNIHITEVEYSDGYFIFGRGDNTVVQFKIKEIPEWLFGIWWHEPTKYEDGTKECLKIKYEWFAQYEETIDKFKPSYSIYGSTCDVTYHKTFSCSTYNMVKDIIFMMKEPELAFCRDHCSWDYNEDYHSRAEAKREYLKYRKHKDLEDGMVPALDKKMLDTLKEQFKEELEKGIAYIVDRGEAWSPRYELLGNKDKIEYGDKIENGCYDLDKVAPSSIKILDKVKKECQKMADKNDIWWFDPVSRCATLVDSEKYNEFIKRESKQ